MVTFSSGKIITILKISIVSGHNGDTHTVRQSANTESRRDGDKWIFYNIKL